MQFKDIYGHKQTIEQLVKTVEKDRISHALLFLGQEGIGKITLAIAFAQYINCTNRQNGDSCGECKSCKKYAKLIHPDLHFVFPFVRAKNITKPVSLDYINQWREFVLKSKFHSYDEWLDFIGTDNLQGNIYAQESKGIIRIVNLKTFEAKYKILIIYMPEKMNIATANKLLKAIEEPPPNTIFILVSENESDILTTIRSRVQLVKISALSKDEIKNALEEEFNEATEEQIQDSTNISSGNFIYARQVLNETLNETENSFSKNFDLFSVYMRSAFSGNFLNISDTVEKISKLGREKQKSFIMYSLRFLRENFILNYANKSSELNYMTKKETKFAEKFSLFINKKNIFLLFEEFNKSYSDITRNASAKILFLDLSLKIYQLLKIKDL